MVVRSRVGVALGLSGLVVGGLLTVAPLSPAGAVPGFEFERIAGPDRFATSAQVAEELGGGANAVLANGQDGRFADALAANYLAGDLAGPVLLTRENATPNVVLNALEDAGVSQVTVVGGESVISEGQVEDLESRGYDVTREAGANRYETNAAIIDAVGEAPEDLALIATGENFADALAAGPLAEQGHPIGLATRGGIPAPVLAALEDAGVQRALVVGGESAVGEGAVSDLASAGIEVVDRLAGDGRADTSVAVAEYGVANLGLSDTAVNLASGSQSGMGADALSGGVLTGHQGRPMLITRSVDDPSDAVRDYVEEAADTLTEGIVFGGDGAVADEVVTELTALGQGEATNPDPGNPGPGRRVPAELVLDSPQDGGLMRTGDGYYASGQVLDASGNGFEGATVTIDVDPDDTTKTPPPLEGVSDEDGYFEVYEPDDGDVSGDVTYTATAVGPRGGSPVSDEATVTYVDQYATLRTVIDDEVEFTDHLTIQEAVDAAVDAEQRATEGQMVFASAGEFDEEVEVPDSLADFALQGTSSADDESVVDGTVDLDCDGCRVTFLRVDAAAGAAAFTVTGDDVRLDRVDTITGSHGVVAEGEGLEVTDSSVESASEVGILATGASAQVARTSIVFSRCGISLRGDGAFVEASSISGSEVGIEIVGNDASIRNSSVSGDPIVDERVGVQVSGDNADLLQISVASADIGLEVADAAVGTEFVSGVFENHDLAVRLAEYALIAGTSFSTVATFDPTGTPVTWVDATGSGADLAPIVGQNNNTFRRDGNVVTARVDGETVVSD